MTAASADDLRVRLRAALAECGWSARFLARRLGCTDMVPHRWLNAAACGGIRSGPPASVVEWVERRAAGVRNDPPPTDWRRNRK